MGDGRWAIWPGRVFVTYAQMRMRLADAMANDEIELRCDVNALVNSELVELCGNWWTFTKERPNFSNEYCGDHDYSMNY